MQHLSMRDVLHLLKLIGKSQVILKWVDVSTLHGLVLNLLIIWILFNQLILGQVLNGRFTMNTSNGSLRTILTLLAIQFSLVIHYMVVSHLMNQNNLITCFILYQAQLIGMYLLLSQLKKMVQETIKTIQLYTLYLKNNVGHVHNIHQIMKLHSTILP